MLLIQGDNLFKWKLIQSLPLWIGLNCTKPLKSLKSSIMEAVLKEFPPA